MATEYDTLYVAAKIVDTMSDETVTKIIEDDLILGFGSFKQIIMDRHPLHGSKAFTILQRNTIFKSSSCPAYIHADIVLIEVTHKTIKQNLKLLYKTIQMRGRKCYPHHFLDHL